GGVPPPHRSAGRSDRGRRERQRADEPERERRDSANGPQHRQHSQAHHSLVGRAPPASRPPAMGGMPSQPQASSRLEKIRRSWSSSSANDSQALAYASPSASDATIADRPTAMSRPRSKRSSASFRISHSDGMDRSARHSTSRLIPGL